MTVIWHQSDGLLTLFFLVIQNTIVYALSLSVLVLFARGLVVVAKRFFSLTEESAITIWLTYSATLLVGHGLVTFAVYRGGSPSIYSAVIWSMVALTGLSFGVAIGAGILAFVVLICYKLI